MFCLSLKPELYPIKNLPFRLKQGYPLFIPYRFFEPPMGNPRYSLPGHSTLLIAAALVRKDEGAIL